ncbi:hypothetical protein PR202_gb07968 [Eleusine coracana subsp. coracana]|uniref:Uncharacterized protein n=1 Tax=Eleusine coracana subsp. coracana TaxID=191504 RepID=A0AAV5EDG2_ELECO|nr:hypothetical protein PR202_gb07968 [Eleusine coracana subsp. coracana]
MGNRRSQSPPEKIKSSEDLGGDRRPTTVAEAHDTVPSHARVRAWRILYVALKLEKFDATLKKLELLVVGRLERIKMPSPSAGAGWLYQNDTNKEPRREQGDFYDEKVLDRQQAYSHLYEARA